VRDILGALVLKRAISPFEKVKAGTVERERVDAGQHVSEKRLFAPVPHFLGLEKRLNGIENEEVTRFDRSDRGNRFVNVRRAAMHCAALTEVEQTELILYGASHGASYVALKNRKRDLQVKGAGDDGQGKVKSVRCLALHVLPQVEVNQFDSVGIAYMA
jgi:hypothetical protein